MKQLFLNYWFFIGMGAVIGLAFVFPALGPWFKEWKILNIGIFLVFAITGLTLDTRSIIDQLKQVRVLLAALGSSLIIIPVVTFLAARLVFPDTPDFVIGAVIMAVAPVTVASGTVMTALALGNVTLSLFICVLCNVVALFTIPFLLTLLLQFGATIDLPVLHMLGNLIITVLLPTVVGQLAQPWLKSRIAACKPAFSIFSQAVVLLIIFNAVSASTARMGEAGTLIFGLLGFMIVLHVLILLINYGLARLIRLDQASTSAFTIHTSQKTLTVSYVVWAGYFAVVYPLAMLPAIAYHLIQMIMDTFVARQFRRQAQKLEKGY